MANNLMRFDPFGSIARFDPFRNLDNFFKELAVAPASRGMETMPRIRMDVSETETAYEVKAEMPGLKKEDIKVAIDGNQVSVSAEMKEERESNGAGMLCSERYYGQQYRSFTLPQDVDEATAQAKYENGVLQLTLPKKPGTGGKQLSIE